jgi:hypothetical protein
VVTHPYDATTTLALRDTGLRRHHAILVLLVLWPTLDADKPRPVKVQHVANYLRLDRHTVRRAIVLLVRRGYLRKVVERQPPNVPARYCRRPPRGDAVPPDTPAPRSATPRAS